MVDLGWSHQESPFHAGEMVIQERVGVRDRIEAQGRRIIRDFLTEQHRQFFAQLPFILAGTIDSQRRPWASMLVGEPGFLSTPDDRSLLVTTTPLVGDPIAQTLIPDADIGLLGIELATRRRNRLNGRIGAVDATGFSVRVGQSFGNCPQYIQARTVEYIAKPSSPPFATSIEALAAPERAIITTADTFFIATVFRGDVAHPSEGIDVSHRGGKPGFVRIDDSQTLTFPDFSGNLHFSTIGNLLFDPRAGLLFIDFARGDLLYLTGTAQTIWDSDELRAFAGAERLIRFAVTAGYRVTGSLPFRWSNPEYSPFLDRTGTWEKI